VDEEQKYRKGRRRQRSAALSTPPAVHVHIGSDGPTSNGSLSSRGIYTSDTGEYWQQTEHSWHRHYNFSWVAKSKYFTFVVILFSLV